MVNLQTVAAINGSAVLLLLILIFSSQKSIHNRLPDNIMFFIMVGCAIFQCVVESVTFFIDGVAGSGAYVLSVAANSALYINNICFTLLWTIYADYKMFSDMGRIKKRYRFLAIPAAIISLGAIVNLFTPVFFTIGADNVYHREMPFIIAFAVTYAYLAYGVMLIYHNRKKGNRYMFLPALMFMIPIAIGSVIQFFFYGISIVWMCVAIALVSLYINVQNEVSYVDPLSGMFTRQYMNLYLYAETRRPETKKFFAGIMLDIDDFKGINDGFGHLTGDDAIRSAGKILRSCVPMHGVVTRFAGDEFVVLLHVDSVAHVTELMADIKEETERFNREDGKPYKLIFSMGYTVYNHGRDTVDGFLNRMDAEMYTEKNAKKLARKAAQDAVQNS